MKTMIISARRLFCWVLLGLTCSCYRHSLSTSKYTCLVPLMQPYNDMVPVSFCQLPTTKKQVVYVRGAYSGIDEYWSFYPYGRPNAADKDCLGQPRVELTLPDQVPDDVQAKLRRLHASDANHYLVVDAIGSYEDEQPGGYGHLGHNKAQFIVQKLVQVTLVTTKRRKILSVQ